MVPNLETHLILNIGSKNFHHILQYLKFNMTTFPVHIKPVNKLNSSVNQFNAGVDWDQNWQWYTVLGWERMFAAGLILNGKKNPTFLVPLKFVLWNELFQKMEKWYVIEIVTYNSPFLIKNFAKHFHGTFYHQVLI